jgi:chlorophyllase
MEYSMHFKRIVSITVFIIAHMCASWFLPWGGSLYAYVSPGNFYAPGELSVNRVTIPEPTAPVALDVYVPSVFDTYSIVIFQHGFSGSIGAYETIATQLASHGFVVILPQMYPPGDFGAAPTPEEEATLGVQIISWVEGNINSHIPVTADTSLLGLAGHSRGGQTAYRMAQQVPQKVKALSGVDPVDGLEIFGQTLAVPGPLSFDIPTYILGTGLGPIIVDDFLACAPEEIGPIHFYCNSPNPTWLVVATTHGHGDMIDEEDFSDFCPGGPDRDGMRALTGGTLAAFFSGILQGNGTALSVLSDPGAAPVHTEMEKNKLGGVCGDVVLTGQIPTLSEWGLIIFMTSILAMGVLNLLKKGVMVRSRR